MSMLSSLNTLVEGLVEQWGYLGIFGAMVLENVIPPIPSELIMPLAGFYVAQGKLNVLLVVLAGLLGTPSPAAGFSATAPPWCSGAA